MLMVVGNYLRTNIKYWNIVDFRRRRIQGWGEEEEKLSEFLRNVCLNSSLVPNVAKKLSELRFSATKAVPSWAAEAVG